MTHHRFRESFLDAVNANFIQPLVHLRTKQEKERKALKDTQVVRRLCM